MILQIHHIALQVTDLEVARAFYVDVLGFAVTRVQAHALWLDAGGVILMLEHCIGAVVVDSWSSDRPGPHVVAFAIAADQRDSWRARLAAAAVDIDHETGFTLYFKDPFGSRLALSHFPAPSAEASTSQAAVVAVSSSPT